MAEHHARQRGERRSHLARRRLRAIGLPSLAAWAASLPSYGMTMSTLRSIDCSKSLRLISSAPPDGTLLATTIDLASAARSS